MNMRRYEVTDKQWEKIKGLLPPKKTGRPFKNLRHTFNGILWVMRTGASWRDIPERYGKWNTIYKCFAHWFWAFLKRFLKSLVQKVTLLNYQ